VNTLAGCPGPGPNAGFRSRIRQTCSSPTAAAMTLDVYSGLFDDDIDGRPRGWTRS
jgi:hypothetical protein